jgi:ATP-dependent exoDNAse (exonuclease V) alpha subunit
MTQQEALDILKTGANVFLTGAAGSGKTYLLNQYIDFLRKNSISVGITASTGIAATHMGGTTIHSWSGMGIRDSLHEKDLADLAKKQYLRKHFTRTNVLIIDEISMLHAGQLDMVDMICRAFKKNNTPFGGMQIVMCGDFFQLPPIQRKQEGMLALEDENKASFVIESNIWQEMNLSICYLDEQHRQDDPTFLRVLNDIRSGEVSETTVEHLSERLNKETEGYSKPTRLFTHNTDVDAINKTHIEALPGEAHEYFMTGRGSLPLNQMLRKSCLAPETLMLKVGAQVMFVKNNYDAGYINGTLGEIIGFDTKEHPIVRTFSGNEIVVTQVSWSVMEENVELAAISQIPLRLAWAITVHKSQGMSLDAAEIDLSRSFVPGQGYVALSRVRNLAGLKLMGMNQMALTINEQVAAMDQKMRKQSDEAVMNLYALDKDKKVQLQDDFLAYLKSH